MGVSLLIAMSWFLLFLDEPFQLVSVDARLVALA